MEFRSVTRHILQSLIVTLASIGIQDQGCRGPLIASTTQTSSEGRDHRDRGIQLAEDGDLKGAEAELLRAVKLVPSDPTCLVALGSVLGMQERLPESNAYFEKALKINPTDTSTRRNLASNQFQMGQLQAAKENLDRVLKAKPTDKTAILLRGMVAEELKDYSNAIRWLEAVPDQVRERAKSIVALARAYYRTNQMERGRELLESLQQHREGAEGVFVGAQVALEMADYETARTLLESIRAAYADQAKLAYQFALLQYRSGHYEESRNTLQQLAASGAASAEVLNLLAWSHHRLHNLKDAVAAMDLAIDREPKNELHYRDLGSILLDYKRYSVALEAAKKAIEVAPNSFEAYMLKGQIEKRMNHLKEAVKTFGQAVQLNSQSSEALLNLALALSADGLSQEATTTFAKGVERFPKDPLLLQEYGRMLLNMRKEGGDPAESHAVALLTRAISLDPSLPEPHYQLGNLALVQEKPSDAVRYLQTAARLDPKSSKIHFALRRAYSRLGRVEETKKELELYNSLKLAESASGPSSDETNKN